MVRISRPWFRESKQTWYVTLNGRKVSLKVKGVENEKEAIQAWHRRLADGTRMDGHISPEELQKGCTEYRNREQRDFVYHAATFLVNTFWDKPRGVKGVAKGVGVLQYGWNSAFYRTQTFEYDALVKCITKNQTVLRRYRERNILKYKPEEDNAPISDLFEEFLGALKICDEGRRKGWTSPVGVAKALHTIAQDSFPLWDTKIAEAYDCRYTQQDPAGRYICFIGKVRLQYEALARCDAIAVLLRKRKEADSEDNTTILKLIDERNYACVKGWLGRSSS